MDIAKNGDIFEKSGYLLLDRATLIENYRKLQRHVGPEVTLIPVVKGNCYGYGAEEITDVLVNDCRVRVIGVGALCEGTAMRRRGVACDLMLLGGIAPQQYHIALHNDIIISIFRPECALAYEELCAAEGRVGRIQIKIETGMNRLGVRPGEDLAVLLTTLAACPLSALVLSFAFYGFCGWVWESTVCAMLNHGRFANSGFLLGPCCPIYGAGGIACWLLLRGIPDASSQFVAAALVCSVIEYSVGVLLEKTTGARFWDYSHLPFNLHGRICLYWACAFGLGALCICRLVEPALLGLLGHLPVLIVRLSAFIVAVAMMVDAVCSLASWRRLSDQLERVRADLADRINESLADASDSMLERIPDSAIDSVAQTHIRSRAVNAWLAELGDATLDALREKASMPTFISDGARGLALASDKS